MIELEYSILITFSTGGWKTVYVQGWALWEVTKEETSKLLVSGWMWCKFVNFLNYKMISKLHTYPEVVSKNLTDQLDLGTTLYQ